MLTHNVTQDATKLTELEKKLGYKDIRFYRSIARSELRKERALIVPAQQSAKPAGGGWLSWAGWGGHKNQSNGGDAGAEGSESAPGALNDEQRKELYRAIDWDEKDAVASNVDMPKEALLLRVKAKLETGSFALRSGSNGNSDQEGTASSGTQQDLISLNFDNFEAGFMQRPDNFDATLALGGFRVFDGTCPGSVHTQIVKVKQRRPHAAPYAIRNGGSSNKKAPASLPPAEEREADEDFGFGQETEEEIGSDAARGSASSSDEDEDEDEEEDAGEDPFFSLKFEHQPIDERADNALSVRLRHMEIIYSRGYVEAIFRFFKPPESQLESVGALIDVASVTLEGIRKETRAGLEYALQQHKTVDVQLDLNAVSRGSKSSSTSPPDSTCFHSPSSSFPKA